GALARNPISMITGAATRMKASLAIGSTGHQCSRESRESPISTTVVLTDQPVAAASALFRCCLRLSPRATASARSALGRHHSLRRSVTHVQQASPRGCTSPGRAKTQPQTLAHFLKIVAETSDLPQTSRSESSVYLWSQRSPLDDLDAGAPWIGDV